MFNRYGYQLQNDSVKSITTQEIRAKLQQNEKCIYNRTKSWSSNETYEYDKTNEQRQAYHTNTRKLKSHDSSWVVHEYFINGVDKEL